MISIFEGQPPKTRPKFQSKQGAPFRFQVYNTNSCVHMCQGLNSHYFHIIGDGHRPNSRGLYAHYKDSYQKVGGLPSPIKRDNLDHVFI